MAVPYLIRAFAELFPGAANGTIKAQQSSPTAPAASFTPDVPRRVGLGASNETIVNINGIPHLFVDEGDCVVQFQPAFEEAPRDTRFGTKILPELAPHWSVVHQHAVQLRDAIAVAIRSGGTPQQRHVAVEAAEAIPVGLSRHDESVTPTFERQPRSTDAPRASRGRGRSNLVATTGRVVGWGEEKFPNRKPSGKPFYTSFAMRIETSFGEQVLQGEGLKDAIADSRCRVGEVVSVRRLEKIKVPAFTDGGRPVMKDGQQVLWDKWLWSITR
ncbi:MULTISPECIES: hypothetical protein [unclassified Paraburkholderia]|uniref:hypothetical protein n=1 Tax=unclassified Paraburkholderia TaxID=2615204 RepID=UPI002AB2AD02|nr:MULTISPECIES: hypothetical protein [unclassified Paraburkholderia]